MTSGRFRTVAPLQIAQALVGFGAIAAFTRLMSAEEFGRYALALSLSLAAHTVLFSWAEAATFRFFTAAQAGRRLADHFATLIAIAMVLGLATLLAVSFIVTRAGLAEDAATLATFTAGAAMLRFLTRIGRESDRAAFAFTRYTLLETAYLMLGFAAGVAFLLVFNLGAAAPFAGLTLGGAVVAILDAPRLWRQAKGGYATLTRARRYCGYGAPLAVALAVELVVQAAARLILAEQAGAASLGAYAAAFALAQPLDFIFIGLSAAFAPVIFAAYESKSVDEVRQVAGAAFTALIAAALPTCVGLILVSEPLAALIIGEELRVEAGMVLPWLAIGGLFSGFTLYYWSEAFQLTRRNGLRAGLMLAPGAVQLAMTFVLARPYGAIGAAYAAACGALVGCVILAMVGRRLLTLPVSGAPLARALAATALMAAGLAMLTPPTGAIALTLYVGAGAALYALGAVVFDVPGARARAATLTRAIARSVQPAAPAAPP